MGNIASYQEGYTDGFADAKKKYERPQGEWIMHISDLFPNESTQECNVCHEEQPIGIDNNFCPNCGASMVRGNTK